MTRFPAWGLVVFLLAFSAPAAAAATLNKCIDARGEVTYSNLPCRNARETRTVEIDPVPPPSATKAISTRAPHPKSDVQPSDSAPLQLETSRTSGKPRAHASTRQCDTLTDKLGKVMDKMDQAHRKGYTQDQMDKWNDDIKDLERKKQQAGCF